MKKKQVTKRVADRLGINEIEVAEHLDEIIERLTRNLRFSQSTKVKGLGVVRQAVRQGKQDA